MTASQAPLQSRRHQSPARFAARDLSITPAEVDIGKPVTISVLITNSGDLTDTYTVTLKINDVVEATKQVTVAGHSSQTATFSPTKNAAGDYAADVNGLSGTFTVKAPVTRKPINWWLIGGSIAGVIVIGVIIWRILRRLEATDFRG